MIRAKENGTTGSVMEVKPETADDLKSPIDKIDISIESNSSSFDNAQAQSDAAWKNAPANPLNWPDRKKWKNVFLVASYAFAAPLASSMMAPGLPSIGKHYHITNPTVLALTLSVYLLAFSVGPLFIGPLSEMYGRQWVLHSSNLIFLVFCLVSIWAPNAGALAAFRFLAGIGGSTPISMGGSCISDMFTGHKRGTAMAFYLMGPVLGPVLGPIAGGFLVQNVGFKWVFVVLACLAGFLAIVSIYLLDETYAPIIKAQLAQKYTVDSEKNLPIIMPPKPALIDNLKISLSRPFALLTQSLICFMLSLFLALVYGYLYLMFTTFPTLFNTIYGWGPEISGLAYLGTGVGFLIAVLGISPLSGRLYTALTERNSGKKKPEFRLPVAMLASILVPIGLFWYGWSAEARTHWIMPIIGTAFFSCGMILIITSYQLYLVDSFTYAASALSATWVLRALFSFSFPLFGHQMYAKLGFGWGNSLLAGLAIVTGIPFPVWLYFHGEEMRARSPLNR